MFKPTYSLCLNESINVNKFSQSKQFLVNFLVPGLGLIRSTFNMRGPVRLGPSGLTSLVLGPLPNNFCFWVKCFYQQF